MHAGLPRHAITSQFIARGIVPEKIREKFWENARLPAAFFGKIGEPVEAKSVFYSGTVPRAKMRASIRPSLNL
jgi:hypothetical protein